MSINHNFSKLPGDLHLKKEIQHIIQVDASTTTNTGGADLIILAGNGSPATVSVAGAAGGVFVTEAGQGGAGSAAHIAGAGGDAYYLSGDAGIDGGAGGATSGNTFIDTGVPSGAALAGTIAIGNDFANATSMGRSGKVSTIKGSASFSESQFVHRVTTGISYGVLATDFYIGVTSTASARTITLEAAATAGVGRLLIIKDESGAASSHNITIDAAGTELIDGQLTKVMNTDYQCVKLICTGTAWMTI